MGGLREIFGEAFMKFSKFPENGPDLLKFSETILVILVVR